VAFIREWFLECLKTVESPALVGERFLTYHNISDVGMKQALDKSHMGANLTRQQSAEARVNETIYLVYPIDKSHP